MNARMSYHPYQGRRSSRGWLVLVALLLAAAICFLIPFTAMMVGSQDRMAGDPHLMILFGCQVKSWGPSILLEDRLETATAYLKDHPDMQVIVTGGKGDDEPMSEAQCMFEYLTEHGIEETRILRESTSRNTNQNVHYTLELMNQFGMDPSQDVLLVSNGFHLTRITMLWNRVNPESGNISTLAAPCTHIPSLIWMHIREPIAIVKSFFLDWDV